MSMACTDRGKQGPCHCIVHRPDVSCKKHMLKRKYEGTPSPYHSAGSRLSLQAAKGCHAREAQGVLRASTEQHILLLAQASLFHSGPLMLHLHQYEHMCCP